MPRTAPLSLLALCLLAGPGAALASGTRVGFKDAFATARGNAFVATADNPSAIYYNPAGITQLSGARVSTNLYAVALTSDYAGPGGRAALDRDPLLVPSLFATWTAADAPWSVGLGVYAPFGLETEWPADSPLRTFATRNEQTYQTYNLTGAWRFSPAFSLGAGVTFNQVSTDLRRALGVIAPGDLFRFEGEGDTVGATLGVLWKPHQKHQLGLSYSHRTRVTLKGSSQTLPLIAGEPAEATFDFPAVVIAGWSYRPAPLWNLEVNLDWTDWESLDTVTVRKPSGAVPLAFDWQPGFFYEFGVTRHAGDFAFSAGYLFTEDSTPDATYTPAVPDSDRGFYSLGVGYRGERVDLDLAWHFGDGGTRQVRGSPGSLLPGATADGAYRNRLQALSLSASVKF